MLNQLRSASRAVVRELTGVHGDWRDFAAGIGMEALLALALGLIALAVVEIMVLVAA